jgi:hypothetical protein
MREHSISGMITGRENRKFSKKNLIATLFTTYSPRTAQGYRIKIQAQTICVVTRENPE